MTTCGVWGAASWGRESSGRPCPPSAGRSWRSGMRSRPPSATGACASRGPTAGRMCWISLTGFPKRGTIPFSCSSRPRTPFSSAGTAMKTTPCGSRRHIPNATRSGTWRFSRRRPNAGACCSIRPATAGPGKRWDMCPCPGTRTPLLCRRAGGRWPRRSMACGGCGRGCPPTPTCALPIPGRWTRWPPWQWTTREKIPPRIMSMSGWRTRLIMCVRVKTVKRPPCPTSTLPSSTRSTAA